MKHITVAAIIAIIVSIIGCSQMATVRQVSRHEPILAKSGRTKPIMFKKIVSIIPRGRIVGNMQTGRICSYKGPFVWKGDKTNISDLELGDILKNRMDKYGYTVVGDPDSLFDDRSADKAEFLIAGRIKDVSAEMCFPRSGYDDWITAKGGVYMEVEWELYSKKTRDVALKLTTRGSASEITKTQSYQEMFYQAFNSAVENMLADKTFYQQVALDKEVHPQKTEVTESDIKVRYRSVNDVRKTDGFNRDEMVGTMRSSVVTIFSGGGHGSGFLISEDGYVLTNEHVVGGASFVNVRFVTGKEVTGQVIRVNKGRDVALVKLERDIYPCLALGNTSMVNIGEEVFSIGTPLYEDLSQTVTKGIVSSFRIKDEVKYVQSDVNIHPGNSGGPLVSLQKGVVGICVSGITFGPYTLGLNYFIPIEEAVKAVRVVKDHA